MKIDFKSKNVVYFLMGKLSPKHSFQIVSKPQKKKRKSLEKGYDNVGKRGLCTSHAC